MTNYSLVRRITTVLVLAGTAFIDALAVEPSKNAELKPRDAEQIEFFSALDKGKIEAQFIPSNATRAKVIIKNKSGQPLDIALPRSFAGMPVLAQIGNLGIGGANQGIPGVLGLGNGQQFGIGNGQSFGGGTSQTIGGGFPQGQGQGQMGIGQQFGPNLGQGNFGRGLFRVDPDKARKIDVNTVCLEYGKPDPNPRLPYRIVRLNQVTTNPRIEWICSRLAEGGISQSVAQAAAWNLANGLSWQTLLAIDRRNSKYTGREKMFSQQEVSQARILLDSQRTSLVSETTDAYDAGNSYSLNP